jgi:hypothetical protein
VASNFIDIVNSSEAFAAFALSTSKEFYWERNTLATGIAVMEAALAGKRD